VEHARQPQVLGVTRRARDLLPAVDPLRGLADGPHSRLPPPALPPGIRRAGPRCLHGRGPGPPVVGVAPAAVWCCR